jgi:nitrite reductase (cytochrome c-552)
MREKGYRGLLCRQWSDWGPQVMNSIGCSDCHDASNMDLRPQDLRCMRLGLRGMDVKKASRQEMRSLVCAQCHTEYYFSKNPKEKNYLYFPQDSGMTVEAIEAYYDKIGFYDYINQLSRTPI